MFKYIFLCSMVFVIMHCDAMEISKTTTNPHVSMNDMYMMPDEKFPSVFGEVTSEVMNKIKNQEDKREKRKEINTLMQLFGSTRHRIVLLDQNKEFFESVIAVRTFAIENYQSYLQPRHFALLYFL